MRLCPLVGMGRNAETGGGLDRLDRPPHLAVPCHVPDTCAADETADRSADLEPDARPHRTTEHKPERAADRRSRRHTRKPTQRRTSRNGLVADVCIEEILHIAARVRDLGVDVDAARDATGLIVEAQEVFASHPIDFTTLVVDLESPVLRDERRGTRELPRRPDVTPHIPEHEVRMRGDADPKRLGGKRQGLHKDVRHILAETVDGLEQIAAERGIGQADHHTLAVLP